VLRLHLENAKPGMKLAMPVTHPAQPAMVLLHAGIVLDGHMIERLGEVDVRCMWIDHPAVRDLGEHLNPESLRAQTNVATTTVEAIDSALAGCGGRLDYLRYRTAIRELIRALLNAPSSTVFVEEMIRGPRPALAHAANVCILSVMTGLRMADRLIEERPRLDEEHAKDVTNLGLGAMFHDIGMLRLDNDVLSDWRTKHDEFDPRWRAHAKIGWSLVREKIGAAGAAAVLHHHQRYDGSGFPRVNTRGRTRHALVGKDIHVFGRIVAAADTLDALRFPHHEAPLRSSDDEEPPVETAAMSTVRALSLMHKPPHCDRLDPQVFRALLSIAPPYAPGSIVTLSNGEDALVTDWTPMDPCRPTVQTIDLKNVEESLMDSRTYALVAHKALTVVRAQGFDVALDNFYPETEPAASDEADTDADAEHDTPTKRAG
jgi:HD-GYP domain-containing protein (c-di-GMP phosphodiesterase class II)